MNENPEYLQEPYTIYKSNFVPRLNLLTGYGSKISTKYYVRGNKGDPLTARFRRVYSICYSNTASYYVIVNGSRMFIPDYRFHDLFDSKD